VEAGRTIVEIAIVGEGDGRSRHVESVLAATGFNVSWEGSDVQELVDDGVAADLVVIACERLESAKEWNRVLAAELPDVRVVVVASVTGRRAFREAIEEGVDGLVLEADLERSLPAAVDAVLSGHLVLPRQLREHMTKPTLSTREKQILGMVVMGFSNGEIARKLFVAESTVKSHLSSAFVKMGVRSRNEATALILDAENGLGTGILAISDDTQTVGTGQLGA
jgi:DNA-binding NarL/FixJ family response regulator